MDVISNFLLHEFDFTCCQNVYRCFPSQFDEEFLNRQEAQSQSVKYEEKIVELQAELQAFRSQVTAFTLFICLVMFIVVFVIVTCFVLNNNSITLLYITLRQIITQTFLLFKSLEAHFKKNLGNTL